MIESIGVARIVIEPEGWRFEANRKFAIVR
jgi:hypothetical protein